MTGSAGPHRQIARWAAGLRPKEGLVLGTPYWMPGCHRRPCGTGVIQDLYISGVASTCYVRSYEFGATSVCHQPSRVTQEAQHGPSEAGLKQ